MEQNGKPEGRVTELSELHAAAMRRLRRRVTGSGRIVIPAVPSLLERSCEKLLTAFSILERPFNDAEAKEVREILARLVQRAWSMSPYSRLVIRYETDSGADGGITYNVETVVSSVAQEYDSWINSRPQPFFGAHANAKVLSVAHSLGPPAAVPILDIGAGPGRNMLPLARAGFPTDGVEISGEFAQMLRTSLAEETLPGRVFEGDALDPALQIPEQHYKLVVLAGLLVAHVRDLAHLRAVFEAVSKVLTRGGQVLFSIFLTVEGFEPDRLISELEEVFWTVMFTPTELKEAMLGLDLEFVDDVSYVDYEREHLPESWPPTDYFEAYAYGIDLFDLPKGRAPLELRWLTYRKT